MNSVALENDNFLDFCAAREGGQFSRHEIELQLALLLYTQRHFLIQETVRLSQQDTKLSFNSFFSINCIHTTSNTKGFVLYTHGQICYVPTLC